MALFTIAFSFVFPKFIFNTLATVLTILDIVAHIGMTTIDFAIWSFGDDFTAMNEFIIQVRSKPSFLAHLYDHRPIISIYRFGNSRLEFIRTHPIGSILTEALL